MVFVRFQRPVALILAALAPALSSGCRDEDVPHAVTAQFADENHDGMIQPGETIRLGLDRPLPQGFLDENPPRVELSASAAAAPPPDRAPPLEAIEWGWKAPEQLGTEIVLEVTRIDGETAPLAIGGTGAAGGAMRLRVRFGRGLSGEWLDLTYLPAHPVLERVLWEDRSPNLTVDEGDVLRLVFDRPTRLRSTGSSSSRVRVPGDLRLDSDADQLDDGKVPTRFEPGEHPEEVLVVLGSRPRLTIDGSPAEGDAALRPPSTIAVNGTRIFPSVRIVAAQGGWGAISTQALPIEFADQSPRWRPVEGRLPAPGPREHHTVTPLPDGRALIIGGRAIDTVTATDQVLVFDPAALDRGENPFQVAADRLPRPTSEHTTTLLAGPDEVSGTEDDLVIVIGGTDHEDQVLDSITVFAVDENGDPRILQPAPAPPFRLLVPRWEHTAAAVGPLAVLVDGGRTRGPSGLVGCAELLTFEVLEDGRVSVSRMVFRSIPRVQHSLTPLPASPGEIEPRYVLAYGGYGEYRLEGAFLALRDRALRTALDGSSRPPNDVFFTDDDFGAVLVSPVLIDLEHPELTTVLDYDFNFALLRRGHVAVLVEGGGPETTTVLIAGGTSSHVEPISRNKQRGWEIPVEQARFDAGLIGRLLRGLPVTPRGHEAANAVLFHFDHQAPTHSRFSVLPHPAPDSQMIERLHQAWAIVPGTGVLLVGGEQPEAEGLRELRIGDIFLEARQVWRPLAASLTRPRSGHQAHVVVGRDEIPAVFVIGGRPEPSDAGSFAAVEELKLR